MESSEQLDGLYMTAMQKSQGIDNFFDGIFGFLSRKSDFFSNKGIIINKFVVSSKEIVDKAYNRYFSKFQEKQEKERKKQQQQEEEKRKAEQKAAQVKELTKEEFEKAKMEEELKEKMANNPELQKQINEVNKENKTEEKEEDKVAEGKIRPNKGNGANFEKYIWYQYTIQEITIIIPVDRKITGKDIKIKFDSKKLNVTVGGDVIIAGDLKNTMNVFSYLTLG